MVGKLGLVRLALVFLQEAIKPFQSCRAIVWRARPHGFCDRGNNDDGQQRPADQRVSANERDYTPNQQESERLLGAKDEACQNEAEDDELEDRHHRSENQQG